MTVANAFAPGAAAAPSAVPQAAQPQATGAVVANPMGTPVGQTPPVATAPAPSALAPAQPQAQPEAAAPQAQPQFDPSYVRSLEQKANEGVQLVQRLQMMAAQQEQVNAQQAKQSAIQAERDQAWATAQALPREDGDRLIKQTEDRLIAQALGEAERVRQEAFQNLQQFAIRATAPQYAQKLAAENGLPRDYEQRLLMFHPSQMDQMVPHFKAEYENQQRLQSQYDALAGQIDQNKREGAAQFQQNAATHVSGGNGGSTPVGDDLTALGIVPGSRAHLLYTLTGAVPQAQNAGQ